MEIPTLRELVICVGKTLNFILWSGSTPVSQVVPCGVSAYFPASCTACAVVSVCHTLDSAHLFTHPLQQRSTLRGTSGGFSPAGGPANTLRSWSPFFCIFAALNLAVIGTVMRNVHIECHLKAVSQRRVSLHEWRLPRRFKNASTHVENLSQSDETDVANALFNMDTKLGAFQSSHVLPSLTYFTGFAGVPCFRNFGLEVVTSFSHVLEMGTIHVRHALKQHHFLEMAMSGVLAAASSTPSKQKVLLFPITQQHFAYSCVLSVS